MPLKSGTSKRTFVANIRELMDAFHKRGKIGTSAPASKGKANKQAVAIAFAKQREALAKTAGHGG
jgi:hypothetical protein